MPPQLQESIRVRRFPVSHNHDGWRLDVFLSHLLNRLSRSQVNKIIRDGGVTLEPPRKSKPGARLHTDDVVVLREDLGFERVQYHQVRLIHRDEHFFAFDKPAGMLVHPTATCYRNTLSTYVAEQHPHLQLGVVHRLDRDTSGVIVMALGGSDVRARFATRFADGQVQKRYLAVVIDPAQRCTPGQTGFNDTPLGLDPSSLLPTLQMGPGSLTARTRWVTLSRNKDLALLAVAIDGGRQHQIRAHLSLSHLPIAGDRLYAHSARFYIDCLEARADLSLLRAPRQALHAWRLSFDDLGRRHNLEAPPPPMFHDLIGPQPWPLHLAVALD